MRFYGVIWGNFDLIKVTLKVMPRPCASGSKQIFDSSFKRPSLCATTHFGYTFLDLESLTPMGKEPSWDIKNPLSKKFFIFKKCPILMILWNFPNQPKSHPSAISGKKHAFFMKIFGQNLKTIQKHPKEGPETQKKIFSCFPPFLGFFYKKLNFGPQFGGEYHILIFSQA